MNIATVASYFIFGPSMNSELYDYRTYIKGDKVPPENFNPWKMERKWNSLLRYSACLVGAFPACLLTLPFIDIIFFSGKLRGAIVQRILLISLAITIFGAIRFFQALNQCDRWPKTVQIIDDARSRLAVLVTKYQRKCQSNFNMLNKLDEKEFLPLLFNDKKRHPFRASKNFDMSLSIIKDACAFYDRLKVCYQTNRHPAQESKIKQFAILLFQCIKNEHTRYLKDIDPQLLLNSKI